MSLRRGILALHRRLLPDREEIGWTPYLWLFYLLFFNKPRKGRAIQASLMRQVTSRNLFFLWVLSQPICSLGKQLLQFIVSYKVVFTIVKHRNEDVKMIQ